MPWVCHNGSFFPAEQPLFNAANRCFKYGDGLFETALFFNGRLLLSCYHYDRLFSGLKLLNIIPSFTSVQLTDAVAALCERNGCVALARVRITVYRDEVNNASYVIEAAESDRQKTQWNERGWRVLLYPFARKSCDALANLKSANYLPYVMAGQHAIAHSADECLVLNTYNRICDGSKTNLFFLKEDVVFTPALSEGCVAGVMRRAVIEFLKKSGYAVHQKAVTEDDVLQAEAVFLTNAIEGLRWVRYFGAREYGYGDLKKLHAELFAAIYAA
jgi:branched-chain amino acid aminotransferase